MWAPHFPDVEKGSSIDGFVADYNHSFVKDYVEWSTDPDQIERFLLLSHIWVNHGFNGSVSAQTQIGVSL